MKLGPLSAGLFGLLVALAGPGHLPFGGLPVMVGKANADESGKESGKESARQGGTAGRAPSVPMARDPSAAVAEEYESARRKGTREAFELFIARHGDDPLAERARAELKQLAR
ncbi:MULTISPECIES: hypothetical protein [unclassified Bradyrhizobium]|uniref:hypothetical protein n=1 Tax=unclassified Bradyrhizobium TaxID=2631580 RepID=UPI001FF8822F|nr:MULTISPECIES: hypothetical protein [unclassified Bradyrhizobium]MCK1483057.1 hypothetical protein [Bradyrhizobium sp. 193]MCK1504361.1 hypothetical protein [Bradyrhizobium sp. 18]MCK1582932.1 hypothetical protein [Bradyrhizobium sp. 168]UPK13842.1 hypothetical protein IVA93_12040 [Bradyrhizobium sp. 155]UPK17243.1 hypothetical protein IVA73_24360 [Bradyrhizobium sp. 131]